MAKTATPIDEYLATVDGEKRAALDKIRKTIRAIVPKAAEPLPMTLVCKLIKARLAET